MVTTTVSVASAVVSLVTGMLTVTSLVPVAGMLTLPESAVKSLPEVAVPLTV